MGVMTLPILIPNASAIKRTVGLTPICLDKCITSGMPNNAIVSLTKNAESIPSPITNTNSIELALLFAFSNIFAVHYLRTP